MNSDRMLRSQNTTTKKISTTKPSPGTASKTKKPTIKPPVNISVRRPSTSTSSANRFSTSSISSSTRPSTPLAQSSSLKESVSLLQSRVADLESLVARLTSENTDLRECVSALQTSFAQIQDRHDQHRNPTVVAEHQVSSEQKELNTNIVIRGVEITENPTPSDLLGVYEGIRAHLDISAVDELAPVSVTLLSSNATVDAEKGIQIGDRRTVLVRNGKRIPQKFVCSHLQCGPQDDRSNVFIDLVTQILSEPCYNQLRTKEQLGYVSEGIVFCGARKANGVHGIRFIVQSAKHTVFVEERIKVFLDSMVEQLTNMTDEEFERHKEALAAQKLEKPKRLSTQFNKFLNEISLQQYHFERAEKEVVILRTIRKAELIDYYGHFILFSGPRNCALSIHIVSTAEGGIGNADAAEEKPVQINLVVISDLAAFKSSKELYAVAQPYINIQPKGGKSKL